MQTEDRCVNVEKVPKMRYLVEMRRRAKVIYFTSKFASIPTLPRAGETFATASFRYLRQSPASVTSEARLILGCALEM